jgi:FkbM family methyltransferase
MTTLHHTLTAFESGHLDKPSFIQTMYAEHHAALFDYAGHLGHTNIRKIEIEDGRVIMTSRDRGIRILCAPGDFRIAPVEMLNFMDYEKEDYSMVERLVGETDNFFDIGANIGWYSINIAAARRKARMYCFEPIPTTFAQLQANLQLNALAHVKSHNFGFSNQAGEFPFYYYPEGSGNASSANLTGRTDVQTVQCQVRTLDDYTAQTGIRVDFIKCDVEGAELLVFQGGAQTLARDKPVVFSEILRKWSAKFNYHPNDIFGLFAHLGYQAFTAHDQRLHRFYSMDEATLETNFFFLHADKHADSIRRLAA